jgi:hypothetical protein
MCVEIARFRRALFGSTESATIFFLRNGEISRV